jgi:4-amino-4-deoxy-L-arabinose transferase-like glycosyltransferase
LLFIPITRTAKITFFTIIILLRIFILFISAPWENPENFIISDSIGYHNNAIDLSESGDFKSIDTIRTPGYSSFLALIYYFFGANITLVIIIQQLIGLLTIYIIYLLIKSLFNKEIAYYTSILICIDVNNTFISYEIMSETLFMLLFFLGLYYFLRNIQNIRFKDILYSSIYMGFSALVRPISLYFFLIILVIILICYYNKLMKVAYFLITYFAVIFLIISTWCFYNYYNYNYFKLSTIDGLNFLEHHVIDTEISFSNKSSKELFKYYKDIVEKESKYSKNPFTKNEVKLKIAYQYIKENKLIFFYNSLNGILNTLISPGSESIARIVGAEHNRISQYKAKNVYSGLKIFFLKKSLFEIIISAVIFLLLSFIYFLAINAVLQTIKDKKTIILLLIILFFVLIPGIIGHYRYRLPIYPLIISLASISIYNYRLKHE